MVIGRSATMAEWDPPLVEQLIGDHEVIVFDNRGVATTNNPASKAITIAQMAEDTPALASALQIERFDLMGWSMGSYISQQVAIDAPSRVAKLVLCATDSGGSHYVPPSPRVASILTNPEGVTTTQLPGLSFPPTRAGVAGATSYMYNVATQPDLVPESFTIPTATLEGQASAIDGWKATGTGSYEALPTLKMPTLVTWGNLDRGIRPRNDRIIACPHPELPRRRLQRRRPRLPLPGPEPGRRHGRRLPRLRAATSRRQNFGGRAPIVTGTPAPIRLASQAIARLPSRTQPCETAVPRAPGRLPVP